MSVTLSRGGDRSHVGPNIAGQFCDQQGRPLQVGRLLGKGGEGAVYELAGDPTRVAKVYLRPQRFNSEKLAAMVAMSNASLTKISAWPERTLHRVLGEAAIGFVMPRAPGQVLEELLGPGSRKISFPDATYAFVVRTAVNLARAFAAAHAAGAVIGDVKEINQFVNKDAIVTLVDTDGFQVRDPCSGQLYRTTAITPTHQPPELQGVTNFNALVRTPNHDAFGLAVLIFQLLFMGRHPFAGIPVVRVDLEIPDAIKQQQFAWAPTLPTRLLQQPPDTLPLTMVGPLSQLFVRAFLPAAQATRPSAAEWATQLAQYERQLKKCAANPMHAFIGTTSCPLCQVETQVGTLLFLGSLAAPGAIVTFDLAAAWARIIAVLSPGPAPAVPAAPARVPAPEARAVGRGRRRQRIIAAVVIMAGIIGAIAAFESYGNGAYWIGAIAALVAWILAAQGTEKTAAYAKARDAATSNMRAIDSRWETEAGDAGFQKKIRALQDSKDELQRLDEERRQRRARLEKTVRERQLDRYLQTQRIIRGLVANIGPTKITALRSFNIETAFDVTDANLARIPRGHGIGDKAKADLSSWRLSLVTGFRFDPSKGVDPRDIAAIHRDIAARRAQHEQLLRLGPTALRQIADTVKAKRQELLPKIYAAMSDLAQAEVDARAAA